MDEFNKYILTVVRNRDDILPVLGSKKQIEIEVRFSKAVISPNKARSWFEMLSQQYEIKKSRDTKVSSSSNNTLIKRMVEEGNIVTFETKELITKKVFRDLGLSAAMSLETPIESATTKTSNPLTRNKSRISVPHGTIMRLDFTQVENGNEVDWECEIELLYEFDHENMSELANLIETVTGKIGRDDVLHVDPDIAKLINLRDDGVIARMPRPKEIRIHDISRTGDGIWSGGRIVYVTAKLDGERAVVLIVAKNAYKLSEKSPPEKISTVPFARGVYVLDCEYYDGKIYPFDTIYANGDVSLKTFRDRYEETCVAIKKFGLEFKKHTLTTTYEEMCSAVKEIANLGLVTDGAIFTIGDQPYGQGTFKWKKVPTVDVLVSAGKVSAMSSKNECVLLPEYTLESKVAITDGEIVECTVKLPNTLVYLKSRNDKSKPNSVKLVREMFKDMGMGIIVSEETLLGQNGKLLTSYHNRVKRDILADIGGTILDVGSGHGADVNKWLKFKKVYAVEPDKECIQELKRRCRNRGVKAEIFNVSLGNFSIWSQKGHQRCNYVFCDQSNSGSRTEIIPQKS